MNNLKVFNSYSDLITYKNNNFVSPHVYFESDTKKIHYMKKYQSLDYISSTATGGQYIDLGCKLMENTDDIRIDVKFNFKGHGKTGNKQQSTFICSQPETSPYPGFVCRIYKFDTQQVPNSAIEFKLKWESTSAFYDNYYNGYYLSDWGQLTSSGGITDYTKHFINNIYEDSITLNNIPQDQCHNMNTYLFCAVDSSGQPFRFSEVDVYYMKIYKGGTLIRNLFPVRQKSNNAIGLYDTVTDHFYTSQGDEPFIGAGVPQYRQLDYISSTATGGQYIDLGCKLMENTDDIRIDMKFNFKGHGKTGIQQSTFICSQPETSPYPGFACRINAADITEHPTLGIEFNTHWQMTNYTDGHDGSRYFYENYTGNTASNVPRNTCHRYINNVYEDTFYITDIPAEQCHNMNTHLFCALNSSGQPFRFSEVDVYYMKIYKGSTLIRDLIPVEYLSSGKIGLYDRINDHLYESEGDEPFIGHEINSN